MVNAPYAPSALELALLALAVAAVAAWLPQRRPRRRSESGAAIQAGRSPPHPHPEQILLPLCLLAAYVVLLIAVWTVGNNDPIYTRFLYPAYPLLVLLAFAAYARVRESGPAWGVVAWRALFAALLVVHALRDYQAVALPLR